MLKKNLIFVLLVALNPLFSYLFAQIGITPLSGVVIEETLAGGNGCTKPACYDSVHISADTINNQFPVSLNSTPDEPGTMTTPSKSYFTKYTITVSGCTNEGENTVCNGSFSFLFFQEHAPCKAINETVRLRIDKDGNKLKSFEDYLNISSTNEYCFSKWSFDIHFTENGIILENGNPSECTPTFIITKSVSVCYSNNTNGRIASTTSPNPTTGIVDIQFEGVKEGTANIQVYNNIGSLVQEISTISVYGGKNSQQIDLGNLPSGLYNIAIRQGEQISTQRIQKL